MTNRNLSATRDYYDDFSSWYERERHRGYHAMLDRLELGTLVPFVQGADVLEVGAGTGLILKDLRACAGSLVGLDLSSGMLAKARDRGLPVLQGSATDLPFESGSFDIVYSFKVLAHVQDVERALAEMTRVLRPGGRLLVEFYNAHSLRYLAKKLGGPQKVSASRTEADVFTRWDTPDGVLRAFPPELKFEGWRGVRVLTPAAFMCRLPVLSSLFPRLEEALVDSPAARFGGFLIAVARK